MVDPVTGPRYTASMPEPEVIEGRAEAETRRLMELFGTLSRLLGYSNREIERRAGLTHSWASKVFMGEAEPKVDLLLKVIEAIGLDYGEFFELAYGDRRKRPTEAAQRIRRMLEGLQPSPLFGTPEAPARKEEGAPDSWEEMEKKLEERLRKFLQQLDGQAEPARPKRIRGKS